MTRPGPRTDASDVIVIHGVSVVAVHAHAAVVSTDTGGPSSKHGVWHEDIAEARRLAAEAGVGDRVTFSTVPADALPAEGYDLVTSFDCLHDMGDPAGVARQVRAALAPGGTWMIVEPRAGDSVPENLNPVGRAYYAFSTLLCTPSSLSQEVGLALGAQAGEARLRSVLESAGFTSVRRAAETPFNLVLEARP